MEFSQLQLNYLDWKFQSGKEKVELLQQYNIPVWVMEPLRGGRLASLSEENEAKLKTFLYCMPLLYKSLPKESGYSRST